MNITLAEPHTYLVSYEKLFLITGYELPECAAYTHDFEPLPVGIEFGSSEEPARIGVAGSLLYLDDDAADPANLAQYVAQYRDRAHSV